MKTAAPSPSSAPRRRSGPPAPGTGPALAAMGVAGTCTFLNLYATQPLLPMIERVFGVGKAQAAWTVSAPTIAVALMSPFVGAIADRVGRRRLILASLFAMGIPTALVATAQGIGQLILWRFMQGLIVPAVYAVAMAYVGETWPPGGVGRAMAAMVTGNVIGGFSGRFLSGLIAEWVGWRTSFVVLAAITVSGAAVVSRWLPPEQSRAARHVDPFRALAALASSVNGPLAATFVVGFNLLFTQVALFTYVTFYLAAPPFELGVAKLSSLFVVYLFGAAVTPAAGRWVDRVGSRATIAAAFGVAIGGAALTLFPALWAVGVGLAICSAAMFVSQSAATSYLQKATPGHVRSTASGVYVACYYVGGSVGGVVPAAAWHVAGWPGCVAFVMAVQLATIAVVLRSWRGER